MQRLPMSIWNVSRTSGKPKMADTPGGAGKIPGIAKMSIKTPKARSPKVSANEPMLVSSRNSSERTISEKLGFDGVTVDRLNFLSITISETVSLRHEYDLVT